MKAKRFLLGLTFFIAGMVVTFGIQFNNRNSHFSHQAGIRKSAVIEVGAPLTVVQLKQMGLI
jgi:hypothetical protein